MDNIRVLIEGTQVGSVSRSAYTCSFSYAKAEGGLPWVSLTMPYRPQDWTWMIVLHPVFDMNLPEGFVHEGLRRHVQKRYGRADDYSFLKYFSNSVRGRLGYRSEDWHGIGEDSPVPRLSDVLSSAADTSFETLAQRFLASTFLSGEQPKVLAPLSDEAGVGEYIIKAWGSDRLRQAENEYFCMKAAAAAGIVVPQFHLSRDANLYLTRRFDVLPAGGLLGFEDLCVLQGKNRIDKYLGTYEAAAQTVGEYVSPDDRKDSLTQFFKILCLSVILRNGNAHLKNFGILYTSDLKSRFLAPAFDIVTTTVYDPGDMLALTLAGKKHWPGKRQIVDFGAGSCTLTRPEASRAYEECAAAVKGVLEELREYTRETPDFGTVGNRMLASWESGLDGEPKKDNWDEILGNRSDDTTA